ncbi:MAG: TonB-dependent receptor [Ignavibacteria bacterium]
MRTIIKYLILFIGIPWVLYCQDDDIDSTNYQTDEIMVTGTRIEQKIIDIPYSVQRFNQSGWVTSRKIGIQDVLTVVPGLFLQPRYGNHDTRITIRGFGSRSNTGIRGVRILLDGIPESEPDGQTRIEAIDFTSIGKIELVKGNSSSLYTNAPGGVINFLTDKFFPVSFAMSDNEFGSFDLRKNGIKFGLNTKNSRFMTVYSYQNYTGYRQHSQEYQNRLNTLFEADFTQNSKISVFAYYVNGIIKIPGALSLGEYNLNDTMANRNSLSRDEKRITKKGRVGLTFFGSYDKGKMKHTVEVTGYGTIKYFNRTARTYREFNRYGVGGSFRYANKLFFGSSQKKYKNEFSIGGDMFYQAGPIDEYTNFAGQKGDELLSKSDEVLSNVGFYALEQIDIIPDKFSLLITGRYDRVLFDFRNSIAQFQDTSRLFDKFTPKIAASFKITPNIAVYGSFGLGFDSPAGNEMDNYPLTSDMGYHLLNPDLLAQRSQNFELGIKGDIVNSSKTKFFKNTFFEVTAYRNRIEDVIVPFIVDGDPYFRNAASTNRMGLEAGFNTEIFNGLTLKAAYTYQNFKYDSYNAGSIDSAGNITNEDFSGNVEPSNPKQFASAELMYQHTFQKKYTFYIKSTFQQVGEMYVNDANSDSLKTAPYNLVNAQIGLDVNLKNIRILGYFGMNNIADKKYVAFIQINSDRNEFYESGPLRNFFGGLTLAYMFR